MRFWEKMGPAPGLSSTMITATNTRKGHSTAIAEIGQLSNMLLDSQNISPIIDQVKYLLELLEADLSLIYSERNNMLVTALTLIGLLFAAWQIILAL